MCCYTYRTIKSQERDSELKHDLLSYCRQIALGLSYLVTKQFVHRDLAARNILVSSDDVCKVGCAMVCTDAISMNHTCIMNNLTGSCVHEAM